MPLKVKKGYQDSIPFTLVFHSFLLNFQISLSEKN